MAQNLAHLFMVLAGLEPATERLATNWAKEPKYDNLQHISSLLYKICVDGAADYQVFVNECFSHPLKLLYNFFNK